MDEEKQKSHKNAEQKKKKISEKQAEERSHEILQAEKYQLKKDFY